MPRIQVGIARDERASPDLKPFGDQTVNAELTAGPLEDPPLCALDPTPRSSPPKSAIDRRHVGVSLARRSDAARDSVPARR